MSSLFGNLTKKLSINEGRVWIHRQKRMSKSLWSLFYRRLRASRLAQECSKETQKILHPLFRVSFVELTTVTTQKVSIQNREKRQDQIFGNFLSRPSGIYTSSFKKYRSHWTVLTPSNGCLSWGWHRLKSSNFLAEFYDHILMQCNSPSR